MKIHQVYTESVLRNFTYLIELDNGSALVIDPWDAAEVNTLLHRHNLSLHAIINTHEHWDHIQGNPELVAEHECEVWAHSNWRTNRSRFWRSVAGAGYAGTYLCSSVFSGS